MRVYKSNSPINCGPCTFINLTKIRGSKKVENDLANAGQLKPYQISLYSSFLLWGSKYNKEIEVYTSSKKINNKMFKLMNFYEEVPKAKRKEFAEKARKNLELINKKYVERIYRLKNPIKKLSILLKYHDRVALMLSNVYRDRKNPVPHWLVAYREVNGIFYLMDSGSKNNGLIKLTESQLNNSFKRNKKDGFCPQIVVPRN